MARGLSLVGPAGVGKTSIGAEIGKAFGLTVWDIDAAVQAEYGPINGILRERGWRRFFEISGMTLRATLGKLEHHVGDVVVVVVPASALYHEGYPEESAINRDALRKAGAYVVCVLADADDMTGARIAIERERKRGYSADWDAKLHRYVQQAHVLRGVADLVVINETVEHSARRIMAAFGGAR